MRKGRKREREREREPTKYKCFVPFRMFSPYANSQQCEHLHCVVRWRVRKRKRERVRKRKIES